MDSIEESAPNVPGRWTQTLTFKYGDRRLAWATYVGTSTIPIKDLTPRIRHVYVPGQGQDQRACYELDVQALGDRLYGRVVEMVALRLQQTSQTIEKVLAVQGLHIIVDRDVTVAVHVYRPPAKPEAPEPMATPPVAEVDIMDQPVLVL